MVSLLAFLEQFGVKKLSLVGHSYGGRIIIKLANRELPFAIDKIVLIDSAVQIPMLFYVMCGMGVIATLVVCKFFKVIYVQARVAALTMLLVTMVFEGTDRMDYAMNRFIGSLVGAVLAFVVSAVYSAFSKKFKKNT